MHSGIKYWGKRSEDAFYPLIGHLLDTGVVFGILWDRLVEPHLKELFEEVLGDNAAQKLGLVAALHDCGKATPVFQCRLSEKRPPVWAPSPRHRLPSIPGGISVLTHRRYGEGLSHGRESGRIIGRLSSNLWVCRVVEGHHGRFPTTEAQNPTVERLAESLSAGGWADDQHQLVKEVEQALGVGLESLGLDQPDSFYPLIPSITGWVSVADWIASDDLAVSSGIQQMGLLDNDLVEFCSRRTQTYSARIDQLVGQYHSPPGEFSEIFGFTPDRPVQRYVCDQEVAPPFSLMAVPMGAGKTEAALERHRQLGSNSLYFALPTMATANSMFVRVQAMFSSAQGTGGALLHGQSGVNDFYATGEQGPPSLGAGSHDFDHVGDDATGLQAHHWLRGRHRGLLAPVGVGTVDQVFAAVLRARYATVRLAAIANTHIVFDEVHSYDPYQQTLFANVLRWLGLHRAPVTLLSATIPTELAHRYSAAYSAGWNRDEQHRSRSGLVSKDVVSHYPGTFEVDHDGRISSSAIEASDRRVNKLRYISYEDSPVEAIAAEVRAIRSRHPQAAIGVIVNTVDACIQAAQSLSEWEPRVLHGRMPSTMRHERESGALATVGPNTSSHGQLIVGTQILEQSLDLDFDFLITELAPVPDLIQRTGRLWRHSSCDGEHWVHSPARKWREGLAQPEVTVIHPAELNRLSALPYMEAVLYWAWCFGFGEGALEELVVPDALQGLVNQSQVPFDSDSLEDDRVLDLMGKVQAQRTSAKTRSLDLDSLFDDEDFAAESLWCVTSGGLDRNSDETATRWDDRPSRTLVLLSSTNRWAFDPSVEHESATARTKAAIGASVRISVARSDSLPLGSFADLVPKAERKRWSTTHTLDLDQVNSVQLDELLGLILPSVK